MRRAISKNGPNPVEVVRDGSVTFENVSFSYAGDRRRSA